MVSRMYDEGRGAPVAFHVSPLSSDVQTCDEYTVSPASSVPVGKLESARIVLGVSGRVTRSTIGVWPSGPDTKCQSHSLSCETASPSRSPTTSELFAVMATDGSWISCA